MQTSRIHPTAEVGAPVGAGTVVWQHSIVLPGATIGAECNVNAHCLVEGGATIGDRARSRRPRLEQATTLVRRGASIGCPGCGTVFTLSDGATLRPVR